MPRLTTEQLAERATFIGGSDAAAVCGVNPYETAYDVFQRYLDRSALPRKHTDAMEWGQMVEEVIAAFYSEHSGRLLTVDAHTHRHPIYTFMGCHIDARQVVGDCRSVVEVKHTSRTIKRAVFPYDYVVQLYHNMIVCQVEQGTLVVAAGGRPPVWQDYTLTPEITNWIITIERTFWEAVQQKRWNDALGGIPTERQGGV